MAPSTVMPNARSLAARIERLAGIEGARYVFGASHHHWRLGPPWSPEELQAFERKRRVELPDDYRQWLLDIGRSGAGPGYGLFEPGLWNLGGPTDRHWDGRQFGPLATPFPYDAPGPRRPRAMPGAFPICQFGCAIVGLLVTAGPQRGRIWIEEGKSAGGLHSEEGLGFAEWMERWLAESEREAANPWKPARPHPNAPDVVEAARGVSRDEIEALVAHITAELRKKPKAAFGTVGTFTLRGGAVFFDQGPAIAQALQGRPLPDQGPLTRILQAAIGAPAWTGIDVPGLLQVWVREQVPATGRDYLGRPCRSAIGAAS